jgi:hypothetical protein
MTPRTLLLPALLAASTLAPAQSSHIRETVDPYNQRRTLNLEITTRRCPGDPAGNDADWDVHLLITAIEQPDHRTLFFVTPEIDYGSLLALGKKGTMNTLVDDQPGELVTGTGSTWINIRGNGSHLHETVPFQVDIDWLRHLSGARTFEFRVNGPRQSVQRCTDAKHLRELDEFIEATKIY